MTQPLLTIEAITYNGSNDSDIMLWVQQGHKCYTDRRSRLHIQTINGSKIVEKGNTVVMVGLDRFLIIKHPLSIPAQVLSSNIDIAIYETDHVKLSSHLEEIKLVLASRDLSVEHFMHTTHNWSVELKPSK